MKLKVISLLSGGIDSPVASYLMMKKGCNVDLVHFHNQTTESRGVKRKILDLKNTLSNYGNVKLRFVPFLSFQQTLIRFVPSEYRMIVYRRMMFKIANKILEAEGASALVTGDNIGQVASQTLDNLSVIHEAAESPVLTPLAGLDKIETTRIAKEIGTYSISIRPYEDCCTYMLAKHPETKADLEKIKELEEPIPVENLVKSTVEDAEIID